MLLMSSSINNSLGPVKQQINDKTRPRESIKNDLPDSEYDDDDGTANIGGTTDGHFTQNTGHFAKAQVLDQQLSYDRPQSQVDPVDMITQLLNQNKTAGRDEIEQLLV